MNVDECRAICACIYRNAQKTVPGHGYFSLTIGDLPVRRLLDSDRWPVHWCRFNAYATLVAWYFDVQFNASLTWIFFERFQFFYFFHVMILAVPHSCNFSLFLQLAARNRYRAVQQSKTVYTRHTTTHHTLYETIEQCNIYSNRTTIYTQRELHAVRTRCWEENIFIVSTAGVNLTMHHADLVKIYYTLIYDNYDARPLTQSRCAICRSDVKQQKPTLWIMKQQQQKK